MNHSASLNTLLGEKRFAQGHCWASQQWQPAGGSSDRFGHCGGGELQPEWRSSRQAQERTSADGRTGPRREAADVEHF
jgi:hypothetical protein